MNWWVICTSVALLAGCAVPALSIQTPFDENDFVWSRNLGNSEVRGQGFLKTRGGDVKTCAGNMAHILPLNAYTAEIRQALANGPKRFSNTDPRLRDYVRSARCDAQGNFVFRQVPAGTWLVQARVVWQTPSNLMPTQGGDIEVPVTVQPSEVKEVILTK